MFGLPFIDIAVILIYFAVMIGIGFWSMRRIEDQEDFFLGGRRFGKLIQVFANFGQATSSDTGPTVATTTYNNGAAGVWSALMMLFATPFYWFTSVWYRRMRCVTLGDYYAQRYDSRVMGGIYAFLMSVGLCVLLSLSFVMMVKTVQAMTPKDVGALTEAERAEATRAARLTELQKRDFQSLTTAGQGELERLLVEQPRRNFSYVRPVTLTWVIVIVVCLYALTGGLQAALISDMVQGIFILLLSVMLIPFSIAMVNDRYGGAGAYQAFQTLHAQKSESFFRIFGSPAAADFTWYYIAAISLMGLINASAQANGFVTPSSSKDEFSARFGMTFGIYLKRFATVMWGVTAMFAVLLFSKEITDPDLLWGYASLKLLGPLNIGLVGLMIAALMAALMSTADMFMITASGLLTHNIYCALRPNRSNAHYVTVGRGLGAVVLVGAALLSMVSDSVFDVLKLWWEFGGLFAAAMWMGILWKRTSRRAVYVQIALCLLLYFVLPLSLPVLFPDLRTHPELTKTTFPHVLTARYSRATHEDVENRTKEITDFNALPTEERADKTAPPPIVLGEPWARTSVLPAKSIFWTRGLEVIENEDQQVTYRGKGMLNLFLLAVDRCGVDLTKNTYSLNETIRVGFRVFFPFVTLIIVSLLTRRSAGEIDASNRLAARLLTPLAPTPEEDARQIALANEQPHRQDQQKLFGQNSSWQFRKWNRVDAVGFVLNVLVVVAVVALLFFSVQFGS